MSAMSGCMSIRTVQLNKLSTSSASCVDGFEKIFTYNTIDELNLGNARVATKPSNYFLTGFFVNVLEQLDQDLELRFYRPNDYQVKYSLLNLFIPSAFAAAAPVTYSSINIVAGAKGKYYQFPQKHLAQTKDETTFNFRATSPANTTTGKVEIGVLGECFTE